MELLARSEQLIAINEEIQKIKAKVCVDTLMDISINPLLRVLKAIEHEKKLDEKFPSRKVAKSFGRWRLA